MTAMTDAPDEPGETTIRRRLVFVFPGFEALDPDASIARFRRAAERSANVFGAEISFDARTNDREPSSKPDEHPATAELCASLVSEARDRTQTRLVFCVWDDLIEAYADRLLPLRVFTGFAALFSFLVNGTFVRYLKVSWRYGAFFLFPLVLSALILALGVMVALSLGALFPGPTTWVTGLLLGTALTAILFYLANRRWHLTTALDDWSLARDMCETRNPALEARITRFAEAFKRRAERDDVDEIVVAAHSLGASFAVPALAAAYAKGVTPRAPVHILTVGSSLMKTALHPKTEFQRDAVRRLTVDHAIPWTDCQALTDPINFYKSNPATSLGIAADPAPLVIKIRLRRMVSEETYRRIKRDFFRLHRQFVLAIERRCPYSYHMLLTGPTPMDSFRKHQTLLRPPLIREKGSEEDRSAAPQAAEQGQRKAAE